MINWFNMPAEGLSNGGQFVIKELTATENKIYEKDGEVYSKVTVNVEGGGGSSDFTTAEVTITNSESSAVNMMIPAVMEEGALGESSPALISNIMSLQPGANTITVPLYKGTLYVMDNFINITASSGSASVQGSSVLITGDCTITVALPE